MCGFDPLRRYHSRVNLICPQWHRFHAVKNVIVTNFIGSTGFGITAFQMFFFAAFAFVAALAFGLVARSYRVVDYYRNLRD